MPSAAFLSYTSFLLCFSNCFKEKWSASYSFKYFGFFPYSSSCLICSRTDWLELGKIVHCEFAFQLVDAGKCKLKCCCAVVFHSIILFFLFILEHITVRRENIKGIHYFETFFPVKQMAFAHSHHKATSKISHIFLSSRTGNDNFVSCLLTIRIMDIEI